MKKHLIITFLFLILLAGVVYCTAPTVTHYGTQIFSDGIYVKDPNTATIDPNGKANFKSCYINGASVATLDANSKVPLTNSYSQSPANLDANSIGLGVAKDPNFAIKVGANKFTVDLNGIITANGLTHLENSVATPADPNVPITLIKVVSGWGTVVCGSQSQRFTTDPNGTVTYDYKSLNSSNTKDTASNLNVYNDPNMFLCFQNKTGVTANIKYEIKY